MLPSTDVLNVALTDVSVKALAAPALVACEHGHAR